MAVSKEVDQAIKQLCAMVDMDNILEVGKQVDIIIKYYKRYYQRKIKILEKKCINQHVFKND